MNFYIVSVREHVKYLITDFLSFKLNTFACTYINLESNVNIGIFLLFFFYNRDDRWEETDDLSRFSRFSSPVGHAMFLRFDKKKKKKKSHSKGLPLENSAKSNK